MPQKLSKYFSMSVTEAEADIFIFGDIVDPVWQELDASWGITSETSGYSLSKDLQKLDPAVTRINVHINSYGGDVAEGLAIHNLLKQHKAKVATVVEGFACSAASVVFMAGDERFMNCASLLMVHNAWTYAKGNAEQLRKQADDLETITQASINAYMARVSIDENKVKELMDAESWILPADAVAMGFATGTVEEAENTGKAAASARQSVMQALSTRPQAVPQFDMQALADALAARIKESAPPIPEAAPIAVPENKPFNFLKALMGGKEI